MSNPQAFQDAVTASEGIKQAAGVTATARITQIITTVGQQSIALAAGTYQAVIVGFSANNFEVTRLPMATE